MSPRHRPLRCSTPATGHFWARRLSSPGWLGLGRAAEVTRWIARISVSSRTSWTSTPWSILRPAMVPTGPVRTVSGFAACGPIVAIPGDLGDEPSIVSRIEKCTGEPLQPVITGVCTEPAAPVLDRLLEQPLLHVSRCGPDGRGPLAGHRRQPGEDGLAPAHSLGFQEADRVLDRYVFALPLSVRRPHRPARSRSIPERRPCNDLPSVTRAHRVRSECSLAVSGQTEPGGIIRPIAGAVNRDCRPLPGKT